MLPMHRAPGSSDEKVDRTVAIDIADADRIEALYDEMALAHRAWLPTGLQN